MAENIDQETNAERRKNTVEWRLTLYVAGQTPRSLAAIANLRRICETHLEGKYEIEVLDLFLDPSLAKRDQIIAVPSLVRQLPPPSKKIIGDLADEGRVLLSLEIAPLSSMA